VAILYTLFTVTGKQVFDVFGKDKQQLFVTGASCVLGKKNEFDKGVGPFNQKAWDIGFL
jgi:hypothetical protein